MPYDWCSVYLDSKDVCDRVALKVTCNILLREFIFGNTLRKSRTNTALKRLHGSFTRLNVANKIVEIDHPSSGSRPSRQGLSEVPARDDLTAIRGVYDRIPSFNNKLAIKPQQHFVMSRDRYHRCCVDRRDGQDRYDEHDCCSANSK